MSGDLEIRDAVRLLGRAVGTLVRAVVGAVRRTRPAAPEPPVRSGPPQAWLDVVAETDPDWLARSPWADQAGQAGEKPPRATDGSRRAALVRTEPRRQPRSTDAVWPDAVPPEPPATKRLRRTTAAADSTAATESQERRGPLAIRHPRRLLPVDPAPDVADVTDTDPPRRVPPTGPLRATTDAATQHDHGPDSDVRSGSRRLARAENPDPSRKDAETPERHPYRSSDTLRPAPRRPDLAELEQVRPEPAHLRPATPPSPLPARVRELPGTWTPARRQGPYLAPVPSEPQPSAPSWPDLPRTEELEDAATQPGPGLAAQLWQADSVPDALTAAQRRS